MLRLGVVMLPDGVHGLLVRARPVESIAEADESRLNRTLHYLASAVSVFTMEGAQLVQNGTASRWYPARDGASLSLRERFVDETGPMQELPEAVLRVRVIVALLRRHDARVCSD